MFTTLRTRLLAVVGLLVLLLLVLQTYTISLTAGIAEPQTRLLVNLGVGAALLVTALGIVWLILGRQVSKPLAHLNLFLDNAQRGNAGLRLEDTFRLELGPLARGINGLMDTIESTRAEAQAQRDEAQTQAGQAQEAAETIREQEEQSARLTKSLKLATRKAEDVAAAVSESLGDLSEVVDQVTQGVTIQRDRMAETATAMEEMNATVAEVAMNASDAASNAVISREKAQTGAKGVRRAVQSIEQIEERIMGLKETMSELGGQAEAIGQVLNVITDIADQTNLLALNAAIEAARAGEAGRGFAVVADEVRKLAEKTMTATQEVGGAIRGIQEVAAQNVQAVEAAAKDVVESTQAANESGRFMDEIVDIVSQTSTQVESIATASEEQSAASEEINRGVNEVTAVAGDTFEGMERSAQALEHMTSLFDDLDAVVKSMSALENGGEIREADAPLIQWNQELSVGLDCIDEQHKVLVDLINQMNDAMRQKKGQEAVLDVVNELKNYVVTHFSFEEEMFHKYGYDKTEEHSAIHTTFVQKVQDFEDGLKTGKVTVSMSVMKFLKNWLVKHIMGTDKQYAPFLKEHGVK